MSKKRCSPLLKEGGNYKAVIDKVYAMEDIVEAHRYVDTGRKKGKAVIKLNH